MRFLLLPYIVLSFSLFAQQHKVDSLTNLLNSTSDTTKVNVLTELAWLLSYSEPDKANIFASQAVALADKLGYTKGLIKSLYHSGSILLLRGDLEDALPFYERGLLKAEQSGETLLEGDGRYNLSRYHEGKHQFPKALEYLNQSLVIYKELGVKKKIASSYISFASIYQKMGNYDRALNYLFMAMRMKEEINDRRGLSVALSSIGHIYMLTAKYDDAINYFTRAWAIDRVNNDQEGIFINLMNIGAVQQKTEDYDEALSSFRKALTIAKAMRYREDEARLLGNIGSTLKDQGRPEEGLTYLFQALSLKERTDVAKAHTLNDISECYSDLGNFEQAKAFALRAQEASIVERDPRQRQYSWLFLADAYRGLGDYRNAYRALTEYNLVRDSLFTLEKARQMDELQVQYDVEKNEEAIIRLTEQKETAEFRRNTFALLAALFLVMGFLVFYVFRLRAKRNLLLLQKEIELDRMKSRFFANISHEFRTPLTLIIGPIDDMISQGEYPALKKYLEPAKRNATRLLELVNQLLDLSKIEAGKLKPALTKNNVVSIVKGVAMSFHSLAESTKISLDVKAEGQPIEMFLDRHQLETILSNLLANAFKFTPAEGHISIAVHRSSDCHIHGHAQCLEIIVKDSGTGIPQSEIDHIFDRFYQADNNQLRQQDGSGIGLALTKELVELHHGVIRVFSDENTGTEIQIQLPLNLHELARENISQAETMKTRSTPAVESGMAVAGTDAGQSEMDEHKPIVLLIEDHSDVRNYIKETLEKDFNIIEAEDGKAGVALALEKIPDLILCDVMMPVMNGHEVCVTLKQAEKTSHIPLILLTAKADTETKLQGLETRADDFLTKPFMAKELLLRIRNLIQSRQALRDKYLKTLTLKPSEVAVTSVDEKFLNRMMEVVESRMADEKFSVEDLGDHLGMSRSQLHRKLKALTGQGPNQFVRTFRLNRAHDLLSQHAATSSEIAYTVGFSSPSYFTKCFHEQFGYTPTEIPTPSN